MASEGRLSSWEHVATMRYHGNAIPFWEPRFPNTPFALQEMWKRVFVEKSHTFVLRMVEPGLYHLLYAPLPGRARRQDDRPTLSRGHSGVRKVR